MENNVNLIPNHHHQLPPPSNSHLPPPYYSHPPPPYYSHPPPPYYSQPPPLYYSLPPPSFYSQPSPPPYSQQVRNYLFSDIASNSDLSNYPLPMTKIKKIMKSDPEVEMVTGESAVVLTKACEMFIVDLTMRSWFHAQHNKRRTLKKSHISTAVSRTLPFDFLLEIVPRDESVTAADPGVAAAMPQPYGGGVPSYYLPPGMVMGTPAADNNVMYAPPPPQAFPGGWTAAPGNGEETAA